MLFKNLLFGIAMLAFVGLHAQSTFDVWVNEFHYDGLSTYGTEDSNEFVELIIKTSIANNATELAKYQLVLYSSGGLDEAANTTTGRGLPYDQTGRLYNAADTYFPLSTSSVDGNNGFQVCEIAGTDFTALYQQLPILKDLPTAFAIIYDNTTVVQLISYEKSFKVKNDAITAGAAAGMTTELMTGTLGAVQESATTTTDHSIQLQGTGNDYDDFTWSDLAINTASPCAANANQTLEEVILAVELLDFKVTAANKNGALLSWITSSEEDNAGFEIQRSTDGKFFEKIGWVDGNGTTLEKQFYKFEDANLQFNTTYFYRLRQVDTDGTFEYSPIRSFYTEGSSKFAVSELFPNPISADHSVARFYFNAPNQGELQVEVLNSQGASIKVMKQSFASGSSILSLPIAGLSAGQYFVKLRFEQITEYRKLIVE